MCKFCPLARSLPVMHLSDYIMRLVREQQWNDPTPIQSTGWPLALSGRDVVGIAQTGSGKTLAVSSGWEKVVLAGRGTLLGWSRAQWPLPLCASVSP